MRGDRPVVGIYDAPLGSIFTVVTTFKRKRNGLREDCRRLAQLPFQIRYAVSAMIQGLNKEELQVGHLVSRDSSALLEAIEGIGELVPINLIGTASLRGTGGDIVNQPSQSGGFNLLQEMTDGVERGPGTLGGKESINHFVYIR